MPIGINLKNFNSRALGMKPATILDDIDEAN